MAPHYGNNGQLSRDERVQLYGIDCEDQVTWHEWTPGMESVCDLVLQNVALVTQKVKFKLPPTKEFDMPYPEPFKLAPGMKKSIPISFRPSKYEPHVDQVQIVTKAGSFFVTVKATVKDTALFVPPLLSFGLCPTAEKSETHMDIYNTGTMTVALRWHARSPFTVRCPVDSLEVGQMARCIVDFEPHTASVFDALVVCEAWDATRSGTSVDDEDPMLDVPDAEPRTKSYYVKCTGVGKMPHICVPGLTVPEVDFGAVFPGSRTPKTLEILNTTPVRASFRVSALQDQGEVSPLPPAPFSVSPETAMVEPNGKFTLTFYFQSHTVKEHVCQRFQITTPGGTPLVVTCKAFSHPMEVRLSTRSINFGEIGAGKQYSRTLQIHNDSDRPAPYHFINVDNRTGVFSFDRPQGVVPANSFMVVTVFFGPLAPMNYYKQVFCVVKGALAPLSLHLIGSAHTEKARPARLDQRHIDHFRNMQTNGVREHPPPQEKPQKVEERFDEEDDPDEDDQTQQLQQKAPSATEAFLEMMLPTDSKLRDISLSVSSLDFGSCSTLTMSEKQVVTVTNRTSQKVSLAWMLPGETRLPAVADERALLSVYPTQCDIAPRGSHDFTISFRPRFESSYDGQMLEAVVHQKVNRTFRLVDLERFTPPWTVAIKGMGHTMGSTRNDPRLDIAESHVRFRACHPGERTYQVAMMTNPGDTTISYRICPPFDARSDHSGEGIPEDVPFRAYPEQGVIPPHQFHLVALEFAPTRARNEVPYVANFQIVVDYNDGHPKTLRVSGRAWEPKVTFCRGQSMVTFPPTCSGIASSMECTIRNVSEIPVTYECKIPTRFRSMFWFDRIGGQLGPSETSNIVANFCPSSEKVFSAPLYCLARCAESPDNRVEGPLRALMPAAPSGSGAAPTYVLQFVGHGRGPAISLEPSSLDLGAVRACDEVSNKVRILNSSNLTVHYRVTAEFVSELPRGASLTPEAGAQALRLGCCEGQVAGRCTESLNISFRPQQQGLYQYRVVVTPKGDHGPTGQKINLMLSADVQFPSIQIADLRTEAATLQPQSMMWTQFQVDGINSLYRGEVSNIERRFQAAIGIDEKKALVALLKPFQLLFGTSAAGSKPTVVYLTLSNPSRLNIRFSFQTPKDLNLENPPYWCDEKSLVDDRDAHFSWVEEHNMYDIEPRSGEIAPGDFLYVKMTYHHQSVGTHILPVVFNVRDGRSILLYLKAHSVAPNVGCLSVRSSTVLLQPVPLNVERGTSQPIELTNSGCIAAPWRIDMQSIFAFNMDNYAFEILSVSPVEGVLQPQSSTFLHFTFTPLEARLYTCSVRIEMLKDGRAAEELLFELQAEGYDPDSEKPGTDPLFPENLPIQTYAPVPGCGAALSIEILDFERCPVRSMASRILVLVNYTSEHLLSFKWDPRFLFQPGRLQIEPPSGELSPESHCIIVFRMCCDEPVDISGEIACFLEWTHISAYGQPQEVQVESPAPKAEYLAFHADHVHEPMRSGRAFIAGENSTHIAVANRLTVSRFRNLMSTAAGQKFLNENLHRTALLASHIPTMAPQSLRQSGGKGSTQGSDGRRDPPPPPSSNPLYVRLRAVVADWELSQAKRDEFLVLTPACAPDFEKEPDEYSEMLKTRSAIQGASPPKSAGAAVEGCLGPETVLGVLEHMIREVTAEESFGTILDNILNEEPPYFVQFEDSAPPGVRLSALPESPAEAILELPPRDPAAGEELAAVDEREQLEEEEAEEEEDGALLPAPLAAGADPSAWRSDLLLDFEAPLFDEASPGLSSSAFPDAFGGLFGTAPPSEALPRSTGAAAAASSPMAAAGALEAAEGGGEEETPQGHWEDAMRQYGEVDLEVFRRDAGEVLEGMLLDMVDDVISGRLNWMRPLPRARARR